MPKKSTGHESAKADLKASLEQVIATGHSISEFKDYVVDKFGDEIIPQLRHFLTEVYRDKVEIRGLSQPAKETILNHPYGDKTREAMINKAAYFIAEKHGFDGNDKRDWELATQQIDDQIAAEADLVCKRKKNPKKNPVTKEENKPKSKAAPKKKTTHKKKTISNKKTAPNSNNS